ncbi:transposase [Streptomyces sp. NPDC050549]|uniref:transposase n=1 Tax=Streptomyces sp. NPDC050549 TaxID=3155406 RepID=UPI003433B9B4
MQPLREAVRGRLKSLSAGSCLVAGCWCTFGGWGVRAAYPLLDGSVRSGVGDPASVGSGGQARCRPAKHTRREILNALAYWLRVGCAWRLVPHDLPP